MISRFAMIVFFLAFGLGLFIASPVLTITAQIAALIAGIALIANS